MSPLLLLRRPLLILLRVRLPVQEELPQLVPRLVVDCRVRPVWLWLRSKQGHRSSVGSSVGGDAADSDDDQKPRRFSLPGSRSSVTARAPEKYSHGRACGLSL